MVKTRSGKKVKPSPQTSSTLVEGEQKKSISNSSISNMSMADIRRALGHIRQRWKEHGPETPICVTELLWNGETLEDFAFRICIGKSRKATFKTRSP